MPPHAGTDDLGMLDMEIRTTYETRHQENFKPDLTGRTHHNPDHLVIQRMESHTSERPYKSHKYVGQEVASILNEER